MLLGPRVARNAAAGAARSGHARSWDSDTHGRRSPATRPTSGGRLRRVLGAGPAQLLAATRPRSTRSRGVTVAWWSDGRQEIRPVALDPLPTWCPGRGVATARGRGRAAPPRAQRLPRRRLPGGRTPARRRRPGAGDRAGRGAARVGGRAQSRPRPGRRRPGLAGPAAGDRWPRPTCCAPRPGDWMAVADHLQVPAGLGYALAARDSPGAGAGRSRPAGGARLRPDGCSRCCATGLAAAAPPAGTGPPRIAVLTPAGESDSAGSSTRLLADALGVPARARDRPVAPAGRRGRGGRRRRAAPGRRALPPVRRRHARRLPDPGRAVRWTCCSTEAVRAGRLGPGQRARQRLADDAATYAWVPAMIRFYLGEEPLLGSCPPGCSPTPSSGRRSGTGCTSSWSSRSPATAAADRCSGPRARPRSSPAAGGGGRGAAPVRRPGAARVEPPRADAGRRTGEPRPASTAGLLRGGRDRARAAGAADLHGRRRRRVARPRVGRGTKDTWLLGG